MIRAMYLSLAGLFAVAGIVYAIGAFLPDRYVAEFRTELNRKPDVVWAMLQNYNELPMSSSHRHVVVPLPDHKDQPAWIEDVGPSKVQVTTLDQKPRVFLRRKLVDQTFPMSATVDFHLEPSARGTMMTIKSVTELPEGSWQTPIFKLLMAVMDSSEADVKAYIVKAHNVLRIM